MSESLEGYEASYELLGSPACTKLLTLSGLGDPTQAQTQHELIEWRTDRNIVQELELMVFPLVKSENFGTSLLDARTWGKFALELQVTCGAPGRGVVWQSSAVIPWSSDWGYTVNPPTMAGQVTSYLYLPAHGFRRRFSCTAARLRVIGATQSITVGLFAAFTPCTGMAVEVLPGRVPFPSQFLQDTYSMPQPIPKGAREVRAASVPQSDLMWFEPPNASGIAVQISREPVAAYHDWRVVPGNAYYCNITGPNLGEGGPGIAVAGDVLFR